MYCVVYTAADLYCCSLVWMEVGPWGNVQNHDYSSGYSRSNASQMSAELYYIHMFL